MSPTRWDRPAPLPVASSRMRLVRSSGPSHGEPELRAAHPAHGTVTARPDVTNRSALDANEMVMSCRTVRVVAIRARSRDDVQG